MGERFVPQGGLVALGAGRALQVGYPPQGVGESALLADLLVWWSMDEASGDRFDSVSGGTSNTLTDVNTVGSTSGLVGTCADFVKANSEYFSLATPITLADDTPWSIAWWMNAKTTTDESTIAGNLFSVGNYTRIYGGPPAIGTLALYNDANTGITLANFDGFGPGSPGNWYHAVVTCDGSDADNISVYGNGVLRHTRTQADSSLTIRRIGSIGAGYATTLNYLLQLWGIWDGRELSLEDVEELYNGGAGLDYPF